MPSVAATLVAVLAAAFVLFSISARELVFNTVLIVMVGYGVVLAYRHFSHNTDFKFGTDNRAALIEMSIIVISSTFGILYFINTLGV